MTYEHKFMGIRYSDEKLIPCEWTLTVNMAGPEVLDRTDIEEQTKSSSVMYQKLIFWMESALDECLVSCIGEVADVGGFYNVKVMLPGVVPSDDVFMQTIHSKLSAIAGEDMTIAHMTLFSSDTKTTYNYHHSGEYDLPPQEEFLGDYAYHDKPWWERADVDTFDIPKDHAQIDEIMNGRNALDDFEDHIVSVMYGDGMMADVEETAAEIIPVERWQPRKV